MQWNIFIWGFSLHNLLFEVNYSLKILNEKIQK